MRNRIESSDLKISNVLKKIILTTSIFFCSCSHREPNPFQWHYSGVSASKDYSYTVEEIERSYCVTIFSENKIVYVDPGKYRMRDRFYITWDENRDILWLYSSDIGTYCLFVEKGEWVKKNDNEVCFEAPQIFLKMYPDGVVSTK